MRHILDIDDLSTDELRRLVGLGMADSSPQVLAGQGVACVFEKPSARTRNSTEMAVKDLGGHPIYITGEEVGIGVRESVEDVARTLACYHRVICARVYNDHLLQTMASTAAAPVVNLLSDRAHPLQAVADVMTIVAEYGSVEGRVVTYVGDTNNVAVSLALAVGLLGGTVRLASPHGYTADDVDLDRFTAAGVAVDLVSNPTEAVAGADVVYTDTWVSMGQEAERVERLAAFDGYMVDAALMAASQKAIFMHCLPAHRQEEVTSDVLDGPQSRVWAQASFRRNAARGAFLWLDEVNSGH